MHTRTNLVLILGGGRAIEQIGNLEQLAHRETVGAVQLRDLELDLRLVDLRRIAATDSRMQKPEVERR
jgi:hypothetical protein